MKYYVLAVDDCSPTLHSFESISDQKQFILDFLLRTQTDSSSFIDYTFYGEMQFIDPCIPVHDHITKLKEDDIKVCGNCEGSGMDCKLYPNGHTEITCEECDGTGEV